MSRDGSDWDYINEHMGGHDEDGLPNFMSAPRFADDSYYEKKDPNLERNDNQPYLYKKGKSNQTPSYKEGTNKKAVVLARIEYLFDTNSDTNLFMLKDNGETFVFSTKNKIKRNADLIILIHNYYKPFPESYCGMIILQCHGGLVYKKKNYKGCWNKHDKTLNRFVINLDEDRDTEYELKFFPFKKGTGNKIHWDASLFS